MSDWVDPKPFGNDGPERRRDHRPRDAEGALGQLLDSVRRDGQFEAVAVADGAGILVAGAGAFQTCEEIAAVAPILERAASANDTIPTRLDVIARRMNVRRLTVDGIEVLLCAQGGTHDALARAAAGCARILGRAPRKS